MRREFITIYMAAIATTITANAQFDVILQDTMRINAIGEHCVNCPDTTPAEYIHASFDLGMNYDSCAVSFLVTEFTKNGARLKLDHWTFDRRLDLEADSLSAITTTTPFEITSGDALGFYREFVWQNQRTGTQEPDNYYAEDSLAWAVELVRVSDGARLALLDTFGVLRSIPSGTPSFLGHAPTLSLVRYTVPATVSPTQAFIRVRTYVRGNGPFYPSRHDDFTVGLSLRATSEYWSQYRAEYNGELARRSVEDLTALARTTEGSTALSVTPNPTTGTVTIEYAAAPEDRSSWISNHDAEGRQVFVPVAGGKAGARGASRCQFAAGGTYFIILYHDGKPAACRRVVVTR